VPSAAQSVDYFARGLRRFTTALKAQSAPLAVSSASASARPLGSLTCIPSSKISYLAANSQPQSELFTWELTPGLRHIRIGIAEPCGLGPASTGEIAMQPRSRFKRTQSLEERLAKEAKRLREEARLLPPGALREELIRKARQAEIASHLNEWLTSPGLRPPE
jgi:hypothetical protein